MLNNNLNFLKQQQHSEAYVILGKKLWDMHRFDGAEQCFKKSLILNTDNFAAIKNLARLFERTNQVIPAHEYARKGLKINPKDPELNFVAAKLDRRRGQIKDAINRLNNLLNFDLENKLRQKFHFELGRLYDLDGNANQAFFHFKKGNKYAEKSAIKSHFDKKNSIKEISDLTALMDDPRVLSAFKKSNKKSKDSPIFLIGFPRSGTTLLDQILDSHPDLQVLEERPTTNSMKRIIENMPKSYPFALLEDLKEKEINLLKESYFQTVDQYLTRLSGCKLIDKLPLNIVRIPLILKVFPNAKFILAIRNPYDVCFSCFSHNFKMTGHMANFLSLEDTAFYYDKVMRLWQLYNSKFKLQFHTIKLENVIANFKTEVQQLLNFLDVDWDDAVLDYHQNTIKRKYIKTPSYHQVSEKINSKGINRSQRYPQMESVKTILMPFIKYFEY